ncbi:ParA family protein [Sulfurirhabdus autotrophica]|uniref:Chromosome partitioning protein n=1 Tax=Sulfurirhabdus autotrophica TaxID=1706046 RepID=A0A4R3XVA6_9PROT|nr:ParA family protein [Sulfurirhabdus autotrophica]TCV82711.1 chromosome partitioning protein [Sulfurirhabdus autotrophica]
MKTVVISNQKGGVGKTAISVHQAHYLEEQGKSVLLLDLDPQANASKTLAAYKSGVLASALFDGTLTAIENKGGITVVEADNALMNIERAEPKLIIPAFKKTLDAVSADFDYCVIDTPPQFGMRLSCALIAADYVLSPIELDEYAIDGIVKMLQTIFGIKQKYNPELTFLGILPNRLNAHSVAQKAALEGLLAQYAQYMIPAKIGNRSSIPEALRAGVPVWKLKKSSAKEAGIEMLKAFKIIQERMGI